MKRTKFGLTLTHDRGDWEGPDGISIGRARSLTFCDGPHPERYRDTETGQMVRRYCPGGEEHDTPCGWDIRQGAAQDPPKGMADDLYPTLTEAWEALAKHLSATGIV